MMKGLVMMLIGLVVVASASARAPYYWTTAQATTAMMAQAKTPLCKVDPNEPGLCSNGQTLPAGVGRFAVGHAPYSTCAGESAYAAQGKFSRFMCHLQGANQVGAWTLEVVTAGPSTIRWRLVSVP